MLGGRAHAAEGEEGSGGARRTGCRRQLRATCSYRTPRRADLPRLPTAQGWQPACRARPDAAAARSQEALAAANEQLAQRSAQHEALHAALEETSARLAVWTSKASALPVALLLLLCTPASMLGLQLPPATVRRLLLQHVAIRHRPLTSARRRRR